MSSKITFIHLPVDLRGLYKLNEKRAWSRHGQHHFDEGRALHHILTETFGKKALALFRLMVPPRQAGASLYAYSPQSPEQLRDTMQLSPPDLGQVLGLSALRTKPLPVSFTKGRRLGFDIRICPIRRTDRETGRTSSREIDAFLHEALQHPDDKNWMNNNNRSRESVYTDWLAERLKGAAILEPQLVRLASFRRTTKVRGTSNIKGASQSPDAVMQGTLTITDAESFAEKLSHGIGRHKSYGFGMLLLRPPHHPSMRS